MSVPKTIKVYRMGERYQKVWTHLLSFEAHITSGKKLLCSICPFLHFLVSRSDSFFIGDGTRWHDGRFLLYEYPVENVFVVALSCDDGVGLFCVLLDCLETVLWSAAANKYGVSSRIYWIKIRTELLCMMNDAMKFGSCATPMGEQKQWYFHPQHGIFNGSFSRWRATRGKR